MKRYFLFLICFCASVTFSSLQCEEKTIFLSTQRSGSNLVTCSLLAILHQPVGAYPNKIQPYSTGRLKLDFVSNTPFLYRTHEFEDVEKASPDFVKLILLTRNYKELLLRGFQIRRTADLSSKEVQAYINRYINNFRVFDKWSEKERLLIFYEDTINDFDTLLLSTVEFLNLSPLFWDDFVANKEKYLNDIYTSYTNQHGGKNGLSARKGQKEIFYSQDSDPRLLKALDVIFRAKDPYIWETYLKRFETL